MPPSQVNQGLADLFRSIATLLEAHGHNRYRVRAYQHGAETVRGLDEDISAIATRGELRQLPGIGKELAAKIEEFLATGRIRTYDELSSPLPPEVARWATFPGLTDALVQYLSIRLNIQTLDDLEGLVRSHLLRTLPGVVIDEGLLLEAIAQERAGGQTSSARSVQRL